METQPEEQMMLSVCPSASLTVINPRIGTDEHTEKRSALSHRKETRSKEEEEREEVEEQKERQRAKAKVHN